MSKIKSSLKNKDGMALPMVLLVMVVLTLFGTVLYMLAYNSFMTVRYMSDQKKAYYFARAGVEFASYAYQVTDSQAADSSSSASSLIAFSDSEGAVIHTNTVYIIPNINEGTGLWEGLEFSPNPTADAIGEFKVDIGNGVDYTDVHNTDGTVTKAKTHVKVFKSYATCYGGKVTVNDSGEITNLSNLTSSAQTVQAYLVPNKTVEPKTFYDENGVLSTDSYTSDDVTAGNVTTLDEENKFLRISKTIDINGANITPTSNRRFFLFRMLDILQKSLIKRIFVAFYGSNVTVDMYLEQTKGNLILAKPENSSVIKTRDKAHNYYIFATPGDLFLSGCGLNVVPTKGYYNSIGLYGDEIVIDGDIIMGVYYVKTGGFGSKFNSIIQTIGNRYRLGTVMLGEGSNYLTTRTDPVPISKGGVKYDGVAVPVNKVYFNGNVYVKIFNQGGSTETYRIFNAGDMAYFYGGYSEGGEINGKETAAKGIDLLKYFLDAVIDGKGDFNYGSALASKAKEINNLYYVGENADYSKINSTGEMVNGEWTNTDPTPYFNPDTCLIRKIKVERKYVGVGSDKKLLTVVDDGVGSVRDLVQPRNETGAEIKWGTPEGGSVFNPKDGNTY